MNWKYIYHTLITCMLAQLPTRAQAPADYSIHLRGGTFTPENNLVNAPGLRLASLQSPGDSIAFCILQFEKILTQAEKSSLAASGVYILDYIPNLAYSALVRTNTSANTLTTMRGRAIVPLQPEQKMAPALVAGQVPPHAASVPGQVDVWISFPKIYTAMQVRSRLLAAGFTILSDKHQAYHILELRVPADRLRALAALPLVTYVQPVPSADKGFNNKTTANARANILSSSLPGGRNLHGEGVVIGIGDDSNPLQHVDFNGRIINRNPADGGSHGIHVMGTLAGAGIMNERYTGFAPKATLVVQEFSKILANTAAYVQDYGMVVTNNSYGGDDNDCSTFGTYDLYAQMLDEQAFRFPHLQHVFAAGNSGNITCSPYPAGFGNILSGYQTAKNVITVGSTSETGTVASGSSRGPVRDGRLKPEITAQGINITSTIPVNLYGNATGTSMAAPAVAGGLGLLYQRYRQLHQGADPRNALMKALICNAGTDKGNEGPDFRYGYGWLNLARALEMMEAGWYRNDSVAHQQTQVHTIAVPVGTAQLKVMLYWNDPAGNLLSAQNLVHDLDLSITDPYSATTLPRLPDPAPGNVSNVAATGADHINNMEQVVIDNPASGTYTVKVAGTSVAQHPMQEYVVVYDILPNVTRLTYPIGNERLKDGDAFYISWDANGNGNGTFTVQYSLNNGAQWTTIAQNLAPGIRQVAWTIPANTRSDQARVRVTDNGSGNTSVSEPFTILGVPTLTLSAGQCEGYAAIDWTQVAGATDYEVMLLNKGEMLPVTVTAGTSYVFSGLSKDSTYYFAVRARLNGKPGRRALAISRKPDSGTCTGTISDNDLAVSAVIFPAGSGRLLTSSALSSNAFIKIKIKNLDDADHAGPVQAGFFLNGVAGPLETISPAIEKGKTYDHTFASSVNLAAAGTYVLKVYVKKAGDAVAVNDTLTRIFRQLGNPAVVLPFTDNFEALAPQSVGAGQQGLAGSDRYDFTATTDAGRLRTFVNTGIAASGSRALTLDANRFYSAGNAGYLWGTFNLSNYSIAGSDVRFGFKYKNHGQKSNAANKVWIRGKDTDPWIEAYDLFASQNTPADGYKTSPGIEVSNLLFQNNQNFSSSFQVRLGQWGNTLTADSSSGAGYSFDDFELFTVTNDIQLLAIQHPGADACALDNAAEITVQVRNSSATDLTNIPVSYRIDDGQVISELVPSIPKRTTISFTFSAKANLAAYGKHRVRVWSSLGSDTFADNDSTGVELYNAPVVTAFPYEQSFESGDGYWHSAGRNSSWAYGTPGSPKITQAASGTKTWKTNLTGKYNDREDSYLYSPCFDIAGMQYPYIDFNLALDIEDCDPDPCDFLYLEYSGDGGAWTRLGTEGSGVNWYNKTYSGAGVWSIKDEVQWRRAGMRLPQGLSGIRFRFVFHSDGYTGYEGVAIDDIRVYNNTALPVNLLAFTAEKKLSEAGEAAFLKWQTAQEQNFDHFVVEVAAGDTAYLAGHFRVIGRVAGGRSAYAFEHRGTAQSGRNYYRLQMVDKDSSSAYSQVRVLDFRSTPEWIALPNPASGEFFVQGTAKAGEKVLIQVYDAAGKQRRKQQFTALGGRQFFRMDLTGADCPEGLYMLEVLAGREKYVLKVLKVH
ncbi:S8 family serine peptidase [Dyadobacter sandarakinus]|uniref:S8 family serine peptidase n=1 Tax=Dyadobacter sandarakinus TaxID=2747268 RepID=A0ABX7IB26_9BACT|nr:S8 family serine peptidase [Dyadobacter sandarakinus]QRR02328.1 S8 family serine peptidase [Dyadobacter sandarakinus]